jgi:arylsulfatase A-like enzyme/tetratricopeptide (TPR) repeat protein
MQNKASRGGSPLLFFLCFAVLTCACSGEKGTETPGPAGEASCNIVLLTIDTIRADRLGCYGAAGVRTPAMDRLAAEGALFEKTVATAPLTLPSHCSILTGLYPADHGVLDNGGFTLDSDQILISETLREAGYETAAFVGAFVVDRRWGLGQGFNHFSSDLHLGRYEDVSLEIERRGDRVIEDFLGWLDRSPQRPFFVWVHLFDPHDPYEPPPPYSEAYPDRPYDGEIAFTDSLVQMLRNGLETRGLWDDLLFILVGDHGESLGEHGEETHAYFVYNAVIRVPLIFKFPKGAHAGKRIGGVVRTVDLVPTILDYVNLPPEVTLRGESLLPALSSPGFPGLPAYSESYYARTHFGWSSLRTITEGRYKYIDAPKPELYDLAADPGETTNLAGARPGIAGRLKGKIDDILAESATGGMLPARASMDSQTRARLEALGYLTAAPSTAVDAGERADPKDMFPVYQDLNRAMGLVREEKYAEAEKPLEAILALDPRITEARFHLALVYLNTGRYEAAIRENLAVLEEKPDYSTAALNLAIALQNAGQDDEAAGWFEKTIQLEPAQLKAYMALAGIYADGGKHVEAVRLLEKALSFDEENSRILLQIAANYEKAGQFDTARRTAEGILQSDPECADAHLILGVLALKQGRLESAERQVRRALSINPALKDGHFNLGVILEGRGLKKDAAGAYRKEIEGHPSNHKARTNLAILYGETGQTDRMMHELDELMRTAPDFHLPYFLAAQSYLSRGIHLTDALALARRCIELNPAFERGHLLLIRLYDSLGMAAEAESAQQQYRRLFELK